ncbi:hypothetical protein GOBAR_AA01842 [Gossypium barbadense]|uniref:Pentatricopeptide repeat-containing protein n=1 Tax=Gossypium barbadense TaxID=3634 RepID=A0A2P5YT87_GOSBA|nr:hypothetical protein GOBAR_AA01842 [Gossypium barbadense]
MSFCWLSGKMVFYPMEFLKASGFNKNKSLNFGKLDSCFLPEFDDLTSISTYHEDPDAGFRDRTRPSVSRNVGSDELAALLQSCSNGRQVRRVHAVVLKRLGNPVTYVENNLISSYLKFGKLVEARKVFDNMAERNVVSWTAMINGYSKLGFDDEALRLFWDSISCGVQGNRKMLEGSKAKEDSNFVALEDFNLTGNIEQA